VKIARAAQSHLVLPYGPACPGLAPVLPYLGNVESIEPYGLGRGMLTFERRRQRGGRSTWRKKKHKTENCTDTAGGDQAREPGCLSFAHSRQM